MQQSLSHDNTCQLHRGRYREIICEECPGSVSYCAECYCRHVAEVHGRPRSAVYVGGKSNRLHTSRTTTDDTEVVKRLNAILLGISTELDLARNDAQRKVQEAEQESFRMKRLAEVQDRDAMKLQEQMRTLILAAECGQRPQFLESVLTEEKDRIKRGYEKILFLHGDQTETQALLDRLERAERELARVREPRIGQASCPTPRSYTTHWTSCDGGNIACVYNPRTQEANEFKLDYDRPEKFSSSIVVAGILYIMGGNDPLSARVYAVPVSDTDSTHKTAKKHRMNYPRGGIGLAQYLGRVIYAMGGIDTDGACRLCERYDTAADRWHKLPQLLEGKYDICVCLLEGSVYVIGGKSATVDLNTIERLDVSSEETGWKEVQISYLSEAWIHRRGWASCQAGPGVILVFGGCDDNTNKGECYQISLAYENSEGCNMKAGQLAGRLKAEDAFVRLSSSEVSQGKIYAVSFRQDIHVFDLRTKQWDMLPNPW